MVIYISCEILQPLGLNSIVNLWTGKLLEFCNFEIKAHIGSVLTSNKSQVGFFNKTFAFVPSVNYSKVMLQRKKKLYAFSVFKWL